MALSFDERVKRLTHAGLPRRVVAAILDVTDADVAAQAAAPAAPDPAVLSTLAIADEGDVFPQRGVLDFAGAGVTPTDDEPGDRIVVTIPGGGGGGGGAATIAEGDFTNTQAAHLAALAGDTNRHLRVVIDGAVTTTGDINYGLRVNGDAVAANYRGVFNFDYVPGGTPGIWFQPTDAYMVIGRTGFSAGGRVLSVVDIGAHSGGRRIASFQTVTDLADASRIVTRGMATWLNTTDELATLDLILPGSATFTGHVAVTA